ncbi:MAG: FAD binding domain-containing protein, partial [Alphaproteobacteria bacterium]
AEYDGEARVIAGGTDLINLIRAKAIRPQYVVDIGRIPGLGHLRYDADGALVIGALATIRDLETSSDIRKLHPVIAQAAGQLGSVAIRNVGTVGGNLCHASPAADTAPALIALGAEVRIVGPASDRTVALEDFFAGPGRTVLQSGEILTEIRVPSMRPHSKGVYLKHASRGAADLAIVGVAAIATTDDGFSRSVRIALGAVAPTPIRARNAEAALEGEQTNDAVIEQAAQAAAAESHPITDVRASAGYRTEMVKVFTRWAITTVIGNRDKPGKGTSAVPWRDDR